MNKYIDILLRLVAEIREKIQGRLGDELVLTERVKVGIVAGSALLIFAAWLGLNAWVGSINQHHSDVQFSLTRLKTQVESGAWEDRKNQSHVLKSVLEDRLWTAETPGLAEAGFERWIRDQLTSSRVEAQQIQVRRVPLVQTSGEPNSDDPSKDPLFGVQRMTAKVLMPFNEGALMGLLASIAENNKVMTVDRLVVRAGRNSRVEMDVSTFFRYHERVR